MSQESVPTTKGNILIVDDQLDNLRVLSTILMDEGYQVRKALNGQMALIACQTLAPDLILLDINMPDINGYEVCQRLKANSQTCSIPIIFLSVLDDVSDKVKGIRMGGADYITKPFQLEEVVMRVQNQLTIQRLQMQLQEINQKLLKQNSLLRLEIEKRRQAEIALQAVNEKLQELALLDSLTEVANRRYLDDYLQREWQRSAREKIPLGFMLCDIDHFKAYNYTYGHIAGDVTLKRVAKAIKNAARRPADLVARYGGEEFAIVLPNTNFLGTLQVAENIQLQLQELKIAHAISIISEYLTLSIGITVCIPNNQYSLSHVIATTGQALYQAKQQGRDTYCAYIYFYRSCFLTENYDESKISYTELDNRSQVIGN